MAKKSKETRIKEELIRLKNLFCEVDANQRSMVDPLLQNAAFMKVTLEDLQESILIEGATDIYQNGANQKGMKTSASLQAYNSTMKIYASVIKTLAGLLPPERRAALAVTPPAPRKKTPEEIAEEKRELEEYNERFCAALWHHQETGERIDPNDLSDDLLDKYRKAKEANGGKGLL